MDQVQAIVVGLVPSIGIIFLFYKIMRAILEGDRNERLAHSQWEAQRDAEQARQTQTVDAKESAG